MCATNPLLARREPALVHSKIHSLSCFASRPALRCYEQTQQKERTQDGNIEQTRIADLLGLTDDMRIPGIIEFVVDGLIASSAVTMFSGPPGSGKSSLNTSIGAAVCNGVPVAGMESWANLSDQSALR
jgi:hypothetical protein